MPCKLALTVDTYTVAVADEVASTGSARNQFREYSAVDRKLRFPNDVIEFAVDGGIAGAPAADRRHYDIRRVEGDLLQVPVFELVAVRLRSAATIPFVQYKGCHFSDFLESKLPQGVLFSR